MPDSLKKAALHKSGVEKAFHATAITKPQQNFALIPHGDLRVGIPLEKSSSTCLYLIITKFKNILLRIRRI